MVDLENKEQKWVYSDMVKEHFLHPRNIASDDQVIEKMKPNGVGQVGSPACGDVMKFWIRVENGMIKKCLWRTYGCASAIASTSMLSEMVTGMKIEEAKKITPQDILKKLGGLPKIKVHCSVLGDQALRKAIENYQEKNDLLSDKKGRLPF